VAEPLSQIGAGEQVDVFESSHFTTSAIDQEPAGFDKSFFTSKFHFQLW
jgi:hypothetical protein